MYPTVSVIVMSAFPSASFKKEDVLGENLFFVEKPFDINKLKDQVVRILAEKASANISTMPGISITDIIQLKCLAGASITLQISRGNQQGNLHFKDGEIIHAVCDNEEGEKAFNAVLAFGKGVISTVPLQETVAATISRPCMTLVRESLDKIGAAGRKAAVERAARKKAEEDEAAQKKAEEEEVAREKAGQEEAKKKTEEEEARKKPKKKLPEKKLKKRKLPGKKPRKRRPEKKLKKRKLPGKKLGKRKRRNMPKRKKPRKKPKKKLPEKKLKKRKLPGKKPRKRRPEKKLKKRKLPGKKPKRKLPGKR